MKAFPRSEALEVVRQILPFLQPVCMPDRIVVAGSLRRRKTEVGEIEIVFVPKREERAVPGDLFKRGPVDLAAEAIREMERDGILVKRASGDGRLVISNQYNLMRHVDSGIPVDLFSTVATSWFNHLVFRTGPKELNTRITEMARAKGYAWNPYGSGFTGSGGVSQDVTSEQDLFEFLGMPYRQPSER